MSFFIDRGDATPVWLCVRCGSEIYEPEEGEICRQCQADLKRFDPETVDAVMRDYDFELKKYLSNEFCVKIRRAVEKQYVFD